MRGRLIRGLLITLGCALAGVAVAWWLASSGIPTESETTERALIAADGLRDGHVYVDPGSAGAFTDAELARVDAAAAAADPPVFVVVWPTSYEAGYRSTSDILGQIGRELDRPGLYLLAEPGNGVRGTDVGLTGDWIPTYSSAVGRDDEWSGSVATAHLLGVIEDNHGRDYRLGESTSSEYWGGTGGMIAAGLLLGTLGGAVAGPLGLLGWYLARRRRAAA